MAVNEETAMLEIADVTLIPERMKCDEAKPRAGLDREMASLKQHDVYEEIPRSILTAAEQRNVIGARFWAQRERQRGKGKDRSARLRSAS